MPFEDITGKTFNKLTALYRGESSTSPSGGRSTRWHFRCECGTEILVNLRNVKSGNTVSCGCYFKSISTEMNKTHGESNSKGQRGSGEYQIWSSMIKRCRNPNDENFHNYGGRGITVCKRWIKSFDSFLKDMGRRPKEKSLDRINNNKGYSKTNCRWATREEQGQNTRKTKLSPELVASIFEMRSAGTKVSSLASVMGVSCSLVYQVLNRNIWKNVEIQSGN